MTQRSTDTSAIHTWLVLMKAHRTLTRHATRSIEALDMCLSDFAILEALLHKGPQSVRELARRIDLTSGSMTTAIDRLETRHLVTREDHATGRREGTARARHAADEIRARSNQCPRGFVSASSAPIRIADGRRRRIFLR